jgi:hypothetical protein
MAKHRERILPVNKKALVPVGRGPGQPPFQPTDKDRESVEAMAGYGMPQADIARLIGPHGIDPKTLREHFRKELDRGAPSKTLREHFRKELDRGAPKANARTDASRPLVSGEGPGLPGDIDSSRGFPDWAVVGLLSRSTSPKREVSLEYP